MFDTAAIAAKSSGWSPIRPRMSRSARTRSRAVPAARRRGMARSYAARAAAKARSAGTSVPPRPSAGEFFDPGMDLRRVGLGFGFHQDAAQDPGPAGVRGDARVAAGERARLDGEGGQVDRARRVLHAGRE